MQILRARVVDAFRVTRSGSASILGRGSPSRMASTAFLAVYARDFLDPAEPPVAGLFGYCRVGVCHGGKLPFAGLFVHLTGTVGQWDVRTVGLGDVRQRME